MTRRSSIGAWLCAILCGMEGSSLAAGAPAPDEGTVEQIRLWSRGNRRRQVKVPDQTAKPPDKTISGKKNDGKSVSEFTVSGSYTSMLPLADGRIFLASDSQLVYRREQSKKEVNLPLPPTLDGKEAKLSELLAAAVNKDSVLMLALVEKKGGENDELWELTLKGDTIARAEPAPDRPEYHDASRKAFLKKFQVPRCRDSGLKCLQLVTDQGIASINVVPKYEDSDLQTARPDPLFSLGRNPIYDYAWSPDKKKVLVLWRAPASPG